MKSALHWAAAQKLIPCVPKIKLPKIPKGGNRLKIKAAANITREVYERLLTVAPNDGWRLLIGLAYECGLRRLEARNVCGQDVDLKRRRIRIPVNKAGDVSATVVISPELLRMILERWPDGRLPEGHLITSADVNSDPSWITNRFKQLARKAGVRGGGRDGYCTLHDLRRAFGSRWASKVPAQVLQRMMRHSDLKVTMEFYADVEEAIEGFVWKGHNDGRLDTNDSPNTPNISDTPYPQSAQESL